MEQTGLPLTLLETLRSAQMAPEQVNFEGLLTEVEEAIAQVPESEQLRLAGEAFLRLAEVYTVRSGTWIEEWEQASRDPIVKQDLLDGLVRQTMAVDLSELMEPAPPRKQRYRREPGEKTIVAPVEKEVVLAMVDQMEAKTKAVKKEEMLAIAHNENVSEWIETINRWLQATGVDQMIFAQLCQGLGMPQIEVWLGVLLGGFELEPQGEFYSGQLWVKKLQESL